MTKLAAVAAVVLLALAGAYSGQAQRSAGIVLTAQITSVHEDNGHVVSVKRLRDRHGDIIGWSNTVCFPLHNSSAQCSGTYVLPRGKIMVAGTRHSQSFFVFAVVGGTGTYRAAGGEVVAREYAYRKQRVTFSLVLP